MVSSTSHNFGAFRLFWLQIGGKSAPKNSFTALGFPIGPTMDQIASKWTQRGPTSTKCLWSVPLCMIWGKFRPFWDPFRANLIPFRAKIEATEQDIKDIFGWIHLFLTFKPKTAQMPKNYERYADHEHTALVGAFGGHFGLIKAEYSTAVCWV